jgi:hypothetical protein
MHCAYCLKHWCDWSVGARLANGMCGVYQQMDHYMYQEVNHVGASLLLPCGMVLCNKVRIVHLVV